MWCDTHNFFAITHVNGVDVHHVCFHFFVMAREINRLPAEIKFPVVARLVVSASVEY